MGDLFVRHAAILWHDARGGGEVREGGQRVVVSREHAARRLQLDVAVLESKDERSSLVQVHPADIASDLRRL